MEREEMCPSRLTFLVKMGLSAAALLAVTQIIKRAIKTKVHLTGKTVLITGSRGLGLALAL
jgi:hypothetical protein